MLLRNKLGLSLIMMCIVIGSAMAQESPKEVKYGQYNGLPRQDVAMKKWRANRFGQFIHWGLYAIPGGVWEGKTYKGAAEWLQRWAKVPNDEWDDLINQFSIEKYDAKEWARMAKDMGVKYVTFTTKHHDGFCLWPSQYSEFDIENTPYKKDLLGEFVKAYTKEGIDVILYYSVLDWRHKGWRYKLETDEDKEAFETLKEFTKNQLLELIERYPEVKGFWFDGTWDASWKANGRFSYELEKAMKEASPGLIVSSRMRADEYGKRHIDSQGRLMGDYYSTYERRLPLPWDEEITKMDWECCMTVPENQWGYHKDWSLSYVKQPIELIEMMAQCASQNGNFLLNFGPTGDGDFRPEEKEIAKAIGQWMKVNGEAIYGSVPAGLLKQDWGYYSKSEASGKTYMMVFNKPMSGKYKVKLNKGQRLKSARLINESGKPLKLEQISRTEYYVIPENSTAKDPFVIILDIEDAESSKFFQKALT